MGLVSLGCPKNLVDGEVMLGHLKGRGHAIVSDPKDADVLVVNTCAFIDQAKQESIDTILELAQLKEKGRPRRLVVTGCLAQRHDHELRREIPEIDATLGTGQVQEIVAAVEDQPTRVADPSLAPPSWIYSEASPRVLSTPPFLAYLKISEGCDYACSFCVIPRLRGRHRSRPPDDVLAEAQRLADQGVRELVLVAQDSTRYGHDLGRREGLADLLSRLARIDAVRWIRVMYAYPETMSDAVLQVMASEEKVVNYVDMPLQHASAPVLKRMRRPTGRGHLMGMVERVRERVPGVAFRTSFIVGFPGESDHDFERLLDFVREARFDHVGVFEYSDEEGTKARDLASKVPARVKRSRRRRLMALQRRLSLAKNRERIGESVEVLVEGAHPETALLLKGRLATQAPDIDGAVLIGDGRAEPGDFVRCQVTDAHPYDLVARIVTRRPK